MRALGTDHRADDVIRAARALRAREGGGGPSSELARCARGEGASGGARARGASASGGACAGTRGAARGGPSDPLRLGAAPGRSLLRSGLPGRGHGARGCTHDRRAPRPVRSLRSRQSAGGPPHLGSALRRTPLARAPRVGLNAWGKRRIGEHDIGDVESRSCGCSSRRTRVSTCETRAASLRQAPGTKGTRQKAGAFHICES